MAKRSTVVPFERRGSATTPRSERGRFVKGVPKAKDAGRARGKRNRMTVQLKSAILEALEKSGSDGKGKGGAVGYLQWLSRAEPAVYGRMLERILPLQLDVRDKTEKVWSVEEAVQKLRERNLPIPTSLAATTAPVVIDHDEPDDLPQLDELSADLDDITE